MTEQQSCLIFKTEFLTLIGHFTVECLREENMPSRVFNLIEMLWHDLIRTIQASQKYCLRVQICSGIIMEKAHSVSMGIFGNVTIFFQKHKCDRT